jgi:hypothetical protein
MLFICCFGLEEYDNCDLIEIYETLHSIADDSYYKGKLDIWEKLYNDVINQKPKVATYYSLQQFRDEFKDIYCLKVFNYFCKNDPRIFREFIDSLPEKLSNDK